jgi:hypothetical protein
VRIDLVGERPHDVAALFVLDLLRLVQQVGSLALVELTPRLADQLDELGVVPVRLVER